MPASRSRRRRDLRWSFAGFRPPRRRPLQGRGMACDAARILRQSQGRRRVTLPLAPKLKTGVMTMLRRNEPATVPWEPRIDELRHLVELVDRLGYDSLWTGDPTAFAIPNHSEDRRVGRECVGPG